MGGAIGVGKVDVTLCLFVNYRREERNHERKMKGQGEGGATMRGFTNENTTCYMHMVPSPKFELCTNMYMYMYRYMYMYSHVVTHPFFLKVEEELVPIHYCNFLKFLFKLRVNQHRLGWAVWT